MNDDQNRHDENTLNQRDQDIPESALSQGVGAGSDGTGEQELLVQIEELKSSLVRSQADYQNLVMRTERDKADMVHFLSAKIFLPLLTQVDHLERAVKIKEWVQWDAFVDGVRTVLNGILKYLESQGVQVFESVWTEVDPEKHEVLSQTNWEEGKIISEFERGYILHDRVLRHAKVVVGNGNKE